MSATLRDCALSTISVSRALCRPGVKSMTVAVRMEVDVTKSRGNAFVRTATTEQNARRLITAVSTRMRWGTCRVTGPLSVMLFRKTESVPMEATKGETTVYFLSVTKAKCTENV